ncbi:MAG: hypothetical protein HW403_1503 [Dehalococcoidia bacterium]|nr:hypothetical protein [Dehalococcoidia bacterium]
MLAGGTRAYAQHVDSARGPLRPAVTPLRDAEKSIADGRPVGKRRYVNPPLFSLRAKTNRALPPGHG